MSSRSSVQQIKNWFLNANIKELVEIFPINNVGRANLNTILGKSVFDRRLEELFWTSVPYVISFLLNIISHIFLGGVVLSFQEGVPWKAALKYLK